MKKQNIRVTWDTIIQLTINVWRGDVNNDCDLTRIDCWYSCANWGKFCKNTLKYLRDLKRLIYSMDGVILWNVWFYFRSFRKTRCLIHSHMCAGKHLVCIIQIAQRKFFTFLLSTRGKRIFGIKCGTNDEISWNLASGFVTNWLNSLLKSNYCLSKC